MKGSEQRGATHFGNAGGLIVDTAKKFLALRQNECPCLTFSRSGDKSYWCSSFGRYLSTEDRMALQAYHCGLDRPGDSSMNQMLGNGMSVNVVQSVLLHAAWALGY